jgi:hypothetical protein
LAEDGIITARDLDSSRAGFLAAEACCNQAVIFQIKCRSFSYLLTKSISAISPG